MDNLKQIPGQEPGANDYDVTVIRDVIDFNVDRDKDNLLTVHTEGNFDVVGRILNGELKTVVDSAVEASQAKNGGSVPPVIKIEMMNAPVIGKQYQYVINDEDLCRLAMQDKRFDKGSFDVEFRKILGDQSLSFIPTEEKFNLIRPFAERKEAHRDAKKDFNSIFIDEDFLQRIGGITSEKMPEWIDNLILNSENSEEGIDLQSNMKQFMAEVVVEALFGGRESGKISPEELAIMQEFVGLTFQVAPERAIAKGEPVIRFGSRFFGDIEAVNSFFNGFHADNKRLTELQHATEEILGRVIASRVFEFVNSDRRTEDMLDAFILLSLEYLTPEAQTQFVEEISTLSERGYNYGEILNWVKGQTKENGMTERLMSYLKNTIFAGFDTTSSLNQSITIYTALEPELFHQMQKEAREYYKDDSKVNYDDFKKKGVLQTIKGALFGVLTAAPSAYIVARKAREEVTLEHEGKQIVIPKGAEIFLNIQAANRGNEAVNYAAKLGRFMSRFVPDIPMARQILESLTFGARPSAEYLKKFEIAGRECPGRVLGSFIGFQYLTYLAQKVRTVELVDNRFRIANATTTNYDARVRMHSA